MKKIIVTILVIIFLIGGGIGLGLFVIKRNNTATSILVVSFNSKEIIPSNPNVIQNNNFSSQITNKQDNFKSAQFILNSQNKIISIYSINKEDNFFQKINAEGKSITEVVRQLTLNATNDNIYKINDNNFFNFELYSNNFENAESLKNNIKNRVNQVLTENKISVDIKTKLYLQTSNIIQKYTNIASEIGINILELKNKTEFQILQLLKEQSKKQSI